MQDGTIRLATLDLLKSETSKLATEAKQNRSPCRTRTSPKTALRHFGHSPRHVHNQEAFLILLLWLRCLWEVGVAFANVFL